MSKLKLMQAFACVFLLGSCQSQNSLESRNKAVVKRYVDELLNKSDYSKAHEIITSGFTLYDNGQEMPLKGVDLFESEDENDDSGGFSELVLTIETMIAEGNTVAILWYDTALYAPEEPARGSRPKLSLKWHGMSLYKLENGLIVEGHVMNDLNTIQKQIDELSANN
jgi:hypothetical protein